MDSFISSDASPSPVVSRYRPQRIIVNDDSSSSEYSYRASPLKERESFLSEDGIDMKTMRRTSVEENHEEWNELRSFIVSDEDDESIFVSASEGDVSAMHIDSPVPITSCKQPLRFAKHDLNTPLRKEVGRLNNIGSASKNNENDLPCSASNAKSLLDCLDDESERRLLLELYPELEEQGETNIISLVVKDDVIELSSDDEEHHPKTDESLKDHSSPDRDSFDLYLKKLRNESSQAETDEDDNDSSQCGNDVFIVNDRSLDTEDDSESEDSEQSFSDEEFKNKKRQILDSLKDSFNSPSVLVKPKMKLVDSDEHFLMSLSVDFEGTRHPEALKYIKKGVKGRKIREELSDRLFQIFRTQCFRDELPECLSVTWNPRLLKTAGMCRNKSDRTSSIELSVKVCTSTERIRDTLIHEMCHAAVWVLDGRYKEGHGPVWKKWASECMRRFPSLPVIERCHDYDIDAKYVYECSGCGQKVKRHSKSLDIEKKICGICRSRFILKIRNSVKESTTGTKTNGSNKFAKFVKDNYALYKKGGTKHGEVMRILSAKYKENSLFSIPDTSKLDISVLSIHD